MGLDPQVEQHLDSIQRNLYTILDGSEVLIEDLSEQGEARVTCALPQGAIGMNWRIESPRPFTFLKEGKAADGALMLQLADGTFEAHIMECKRTVNQEKWKEIKQQIRCSLIRLRALAGVMGIQFNRVVCYTAYRRDMLAPGAVKLPVGRLQSQQADQDENLEALRQQTDWEEPEIQLRNFPTRFLHRKVKLDDQAGTGRVDLG